MFTLNFFDICEFQTSFERVVEMTSTKGNMVGYQKELGLYIAKCGCGTKPGFFLFFKGETLV